ncbi:hypothetical protein OH76DRAFT_1487194 [Lentinus brumalis]|uniref:Uncharacterized protein n=1 Tax=Lentinus brumalis TaxID=2498619 RepID=A0A371CVP9_9APHY|nr:hypothetical protein OH76DRAFT_1487194 [Polyporus brumalis]
MRQSCLIRGERIQMIRHLLRLLHQPLRLMLRATALLLRHHALRARLHLRSLLHQHQPLRAHPDAPPRTSILHPLESTSLLARRVSKARSMTVPLNVAILSPSGFASPRNPLPRRPSLRNANPLRRATLLRRTLSRLHQSTPSLPMSLRTVLQPLHPLLRHRTMNSTS